MSAESTAILCLSKAPGVGPGRFWQLISYFKNASIVLEASVQDLRDSGLGEKTAQNLLEFKKSFNPEEYVSLLKSKHIQLITHDDPLYPNSFQNIPLKPPLLYGIGNTKLLNQFNNTIAIVGTRKLTSYGKTVTENLCKDLVNNGFIIVSGMALGIDAIAHKTALGNNGKTIAVLGCGVDCCYPAENKKVYDAIIQSDGLIISEYNPGTQPTQGTFPARNRIIAALSKAVLVTEASSESGSLITAQFAKDFERLVFAVPGPITSSVSLGTSDLLKTGAHLVTNSSDILQYFTNTVLKKESIPQFTNLSDLEKQIVETITDEALSIDEISKSLGIPTREITTIISLLEIKNVVTNQGNQKFMVHKD